MKYRVEQKYIITEERIAYLKFKLENVMQYDKHAENGVKVDKNCFYKKKQKIFLKSC